MSRFARTVLCTAALALCLVAIPLLSKGQEVTVGPDGRSAKTTPGTSTPSPSVAHPNFLIPEGTVTIYSNFGPGYSYDCCAGWTEDGVDNTWGSYWVQPFAFTPTQGTYLLTQIDLAISWYAGSNGYKLELRDDWEGQPDPAPPPMGSWKVTGLPTFGSSSDSVQTIQVHQLIVLQKGHRYWLVPITNSDETAFWNWNTVDVSGRGAYSRDGGFIWTPETYFLNGAFDVLGKKLF